MKRAGKALALAVSAAMLLSTMTVSAASGGKTILTLEEAKQIALKNDVQYDLQKDYIQQALDDYNDAKDKTTYSRSSTSVGKISSRIASKLSLESAYDKVELEQFKKNDIKRASDYDVTTKYYSVMKARNSMDDAKRNMELSKKDLEIGKIQFSLGLITQTTLSQLENAYKASQTNYSSANSDYENAMSSLGKQLGQELNTTEYDVDMTIYMPATASLSLEKLKADYVKNNSRFFSVSNDLELYEYKRLMVEQEYDDYSEDHRAMSDDTEDVFNDMKYEANRDYANAKYNYDEELKSVELSLKSQLSALTTMQESIGNIRKNLENAKTTYEQNKIKYELGLISRNEFEKSDNSYKDMQSQLSTAIINFNAQYLDLTQYSYTPEK